MATLKKTEKAEDKPVEPEFVFKFAVFEHIIPHNNTHHPVPRSGHGIIATTKYIYVIGGYNGDVCEVDQLRIMDRKWSIDNPIFKEIWRFSKLTKTWTYLNATGNGPSELSSHSAVFKNSNTIVIYGGSGYPFGTKSSNRIYELNLKTMHWSQVLPINTRDNDSIPEPLYGQMAVMDDKGKNLYVSGGTTGWLYTLDVHRFNFKKREWTRLAVGEPDAEKRYRHTMALWDEKLFIFAGANDEVMVPMEKILILDLQTNYWMTIDASPFIDAQGNDHFPDSRFGHGSAQFGDTVYITGGKTFTDNLADFWSLHLPSLKWTKHSFNLPTPLCFHSMYITEEGELTIFGGITTMYVPSTQRTNAVYRTWLKVPSLKTMAMEATVVAIQKTLNQHPSRNGHVQHVTPRLFADYINVKSIQGIRANPKKLDLPDN